MKSRFIFLIFLLFIIFSGTNVYSQKNKILFKVDNDIITTIDLLQETKFILALNNELKNSEKNIIYEISKKSSIRNKIKEIELKKRLKNLDIDQTILDKLILNYFRKLNIQSMSELNAFLKKEKIDKKFIENKIKINALWNEFIITKYSKNIKIDKQQIKKELKDKTKINEYLLSEILFNLQPGENLNEKHNEIKETIIKEGFSKTVLTFSLSDTANNGGKLDWVKETSLNKKIKDIIKNIEIGGYSKPIVVPGGFLILKVNDKRMTEIKLNIDEAIKQVTKKKTNEQFSQFSIIYYNKISKNITINEF